MPLHVMLNISDEDTPVVGWDIEEAVIGEAIVAPYLNGGQIVISGRIIDAPSVRRLQIIRTDRHSREFQPRTKLAAGNGHQEWYRAEKGLDVTDLYLQPRGISRKQPNAAPDARCVWVVHGRNLALRSALFTFLRSIGLQPLEWQQAVLRTSEGSPFIGQILDQAFAAAQAVVILLTGDDVAMLRDEFRTQHDPPHETQLTPQARPNVLFEAGMAFGFAPKRTVLVQIGPMRPFSDTAGRHVIHLGNDFDTRHDLAQRLKTIGCAVDLTGSDWVRAGDFAQAVP